ncbi:unnamed protein product, partial [Mesorhabditis belari]|uniref:Uncharacterized protein n=1 Tax=Mesorhabditis belari TaxID=2138241 RepID=A0AAF3ECV1_9BILA
MSSSIFSFFFFILVIAVTFAEEAEIPGEERPRQWSKAMGLWGKRSDKNAELFLEEKRPIENWNKLNTLWGKRSDIEFDDRQPVFGYGLKRASSWQQANGLWGRRK